MATSASTRRRVSLNHPAKKLGFPDLHELWRYRELLVSLVSRELKVRYKQTALGAAWAVLQPFLMMVVFSVFFGHLVRIPIGDIPYPVYIYVALVPWIYFVNTLTRLGGGLVENQALITKIYFPRLLIPIASLMAGLVDLVIASLLLVLLLVIYRIMPPPTVLLAPLFIALTVWVAFSVGLWLAALNVEYRDIQQVVPFLMQTWFFATPVFYPAALVRPSLRFVYSLNPMVGAVDGLRWAVLGTGNFPRGEIVLSLFVTLIVFLSGLAYFHHVEDSFADVV